ncbi:MAG: magnesium and cobalt exporter, family [Acidimicrobiaceae bacterium]
MSPLALVVAVVLILANGVFVAMEFSLVASRRTKLETLAADGTASARFALDAAGELPLQLAGTQLGVTMASLLLGAVAEPAVAGGLESVLGSIGLSTGLADALAVIIGLAIVVFFHMVFGEMVPKYVALADPERTITRLAIVNRIYVALFRPVLRLLNGMGKLGLRAVGVTPRDDLTTVHTAQEIATMLAESSEGGLIAESAHDLLSGALDFGERGLQEVLVPRGEMVTVPRQATVAEAEAVIVASGHSRVLVTGRDADDVIGFVHAKDLLTVPADARDRPLPLARIRRVLVLNETTPLDEVLVAMRRLRTHVAVVVGEERTTVGLATLEDVLEELVGEIMDESDRPVRGR